MSMSMPRHSFKIGASLSSIQLNSAISFDLIFIFKLCVRELELEKTMWKDAKQSVSSIRFRSAAMQFISLGSILSTTLIIWKMLVLVTGSKYPVVVVLTGSMEPGIRKGDVLFLNTMSDHPIQSGEIVVFKIEGKEIPIVHRVIKVHMQHDSNEVTLLTKGDNNSLDDSVGIYADGQLWLQSQHVIGRVIGYVPFFGWATILMTENPMLKYILVGGLSLLFITSN